ncbi:MAG: N-acetylneuraminate synthase family protein [Parcubacteria group bacterium]|nr:N-acetylneuraminate synthase family protein [Parcubacteria group bacterium]
MPKQPAPLTVNLVSEIGVNWTTMEEAKEMIRESSYAGATHVKMQAYDEEAVTPSPPQIRKILLDRMLDKPRAQELKKYAESYGLTWFATPTSVQRVKFLEDLGVSCFKIRGRDSRNLDLIKACLDTYKHVFISSNEMPVELGLQYHPDITWMFVVEKYPAPIQDLHLNEKIPMFTGFSSHFPHIAPSFYAVTLGARTVEHHTTLSHSRSDVDAQVSIDFHELRQLADLLCVYEEAKKHENTETQPAMVVM